ncbi:hypothetical protein H4S02_005136 [Coemansia sp. RSA 2611]|nr:hypothetical protein H4S02_005136 [Coemansia sp. RSA 2611]
MPPVDIYRVYYMAPRDAQPGTEYAAMLSAIIEQAAARASNPGAVDRKTTDIIIRDTAQKKHPKGCNCGCAGGRHRKSRHRHRHHHHHKHQGSSGHAIYSQAAYRAQYPSYIEAASRVHPSLLDTAFIEFACLGLSLLLSMCLLLIGYKIGNIVCKYEAARDRGQGRGHKGSLARFQDESEDKQPPRLLTRDTGVQCDDTETSPLLSL